MSIIQSKEKMMNTKSKKQTGKKAIKPAVKSKKTVETRKSGVVIEWKFAQKPIKPQTTKLSQVQKNLMQLRGEQTKGKAKKAEAPKSGDVIGQVAKIGGKTLTPKSTRGNSVETKEAVNFADKMASAAKRGITPAPKATAGVPKHQKDLLSIAAEKKNAKKNGLVEQRKLRLAAKAAKKEARQKASAERKAAREARKAERLAKKEERAKARALRGLVSKEPRREFRNKQGRWVFDTSIRSDLCDELVNVAQAYVKAKGFEDVTVNLEQVKVEGAAPACIVVLDGTVSTKQKNWTGQYIAGWLAAMETMVEKPEPAKAPEPVKKNGKKK